MTQFFTTKIGLLRLLGFFEGLSLLVLVFIAVPMKYAFHNPDLSTFLGPIHGAVFLLFILNALIVGIQHKWKFITFLKVLLSCFIPFGTFYIDHKIFRYMK